MIFLHGLESSSQTYKASVTRNTFPELIVPDFTGPFEKVREIAWKAFANLTYKIVDDDHRLHKATDRLDWKSLLS